MAHSSAPEQTPVQNRLARGGSRAAVFGLLALFLAAAACIDLAWLKDLGPIAAPFEMPWWALVIGFAAAEIFVIHLDRGPQTHTFSLVEIPLVVGLFFASPLAVVSARLVGGGAALGLHRRQPPLKLAFNVSLFALETSVAVMAFRMLAGPHASIEPGSWLPTLVACFALNLVGAVGVSLAISATSGRVTKSAIRPLLPETTLLWPLANTSVALCIAVLLWFEPLGALLMVFIATVVVLAYRGYGSLNERYANLTKLYEFTRLTQRGGNPDGLVITTLDAARSAMNAEVGCFVVLAEEGSAIRVLVNADGSSTTEGPTPVDEIGELWTLTMQSDGGLCIASTGASEQAHRAVRQAGWRDALSVELRREHGARGLIAVANRMGDVASFDKEDLVLFNALVSHAEVILDNSDLLARLQHEALHDALTSLPNRVLFNRELEAALRRRSPGEKIAVLLMDLDRFKDVNDTLGHQHGDRLLVEVGRRLERALPDGSTVARLGGDEFAMLLPIDSDIARFQQCAADLLDAVRQRFHIEDLQVEAAASIGIALCPDHGADPMTLLQHADIAMYAAKASGVVELYSPQEDDNSRRRLALVGELRAALADGHLEVWYQPQADAQTGAVSALEALLRWPHPVRGLIPPDEFIPIAEQTGLIGPVAHYVVERVSEQWRRWHASGLSVNVAVNLSMRNLQQPDLAQKIREQLDRVGLPPSALTVEITESSIMSDSARALRSLDALAGAGIGISVDDFGTGYSSLTDLRQLPVREIKIDKSFVMNMMRDPGDAAIVRSVIDLGRNLELLVVAEGVETAEVWQLLAEWGCHRVQGYYLSKPMPAADTTSWLMDRPTGSSATRWDACVAAELLEQPLNGT
jgi:diguanylate cyclase (GGDEF)-like protein